MPFHCNLVNENEIQYCITIYQAKKASINPLYSSPKKKTIDAWVHNKSYCLRCNFSTFISISSISLMHGHLFYSSFSFVFQIVQRCQPIWNGYLNQHQQYTILWFRSQKPMATGKLVNTLTRQKCNNIRSMMGITKCIT